MFLPIRPGPGQTDSINRLIQLTVIQLSGGHCIKEFRIQVSIAIRGFAIRGFDYSRT